LEADFWVALIMAYILMIYRGKIYLLRCCCLGGCKVINFHCCNLSYIEGGKGKIGGVRSVLLACHYHNLPHLKTFIKHYSTPAATLLIIFLTRAAMELKNQLNLLS
jgi:hypothetical protein